MELSNYQPELPEPIVGGKEHETWARWVALDALRHASENGSEFVKSRELRTLLTPLYGGREDLRDKTIDALKVLGAIDKVNSHGTLNRRYFLTEIGKALMEAYRNSLQRSKA